MKRLIVVLFALSLSISIGISASPYAENNARRDPTGQGRYWEFGAEVEKSKARVIPELPPSATCASVVGTRWAGARVWNSTRDGYAIEAELTDKAETAYDPETGETFLCYCKEGFNKIWLPDTPSLATPAPAFTPPPVVNSQPITFVVPTIVVSQTPLPLDGHHSVIPEVAIGVGAPAIGGAVGYGIATYYCLNVGLSVLTGTGVGAVIGLPLAWWIHHRNSRPAPAVVQPQVQVISGSIVIPQFQPQR